MGEIKRRGDSGGAVSSELDAALRELVKKECDEKRRKDSIYK